MVQVDLITGFLGAGKTTFLRRYAAYLTAQGHHVCILENDFGAVNVDAMLVQDLLGERCEIETISGGCDCDTHQRRMRTKLISLAMQGFDRVIIEPSGIFDVDEFFDILHDEPLDKWYRMGNVIAIVDAKQEQQLSPQSAYLLASETANAGMVVLSRSQLATPAEMDSTVNYLNHALEQNGCARRFGADVLRKNWEDLTPQNLAAVAACGSKQDDNSGKTDVDLTAQEVLDKLKETLGDSYGCDAQDDEDRMTNYYGLDMSQVDSWASEASSMSALDPSTAVVLEVKDGYADTAADLLRERYQQVLDYTKMYNMNVPMVEQARLFVSGNYVALLILGQTPDGDVTAEEEAQLAQDEAAKVDGAWKDIFGSAGNKINAQ